VYTFGIVAIYDNIFGLITTKIAHLTKQTLNGLYYIMQLLEIKSFLLQEFIEYILVDFTLKNEIL